MNREIKFRALKDDMSNCNFVYGSLIYSELGTPRIQEDSKQMVFSSCIKGTEGQFIGLKDTQNKDIYESDICRYTYNNTSERYIVPKIGVVVYCDTDCAFKFKTKGYDFLEHIHEDLDIVVLGNIHQNSSIL